MQSLYDYYFQILDAYILELAPRLDYDRHICGPLRSSYLIKEAIKLYTTKKNLKTFDVEEVPRPGAVGRVMNEYFARDKVKSVFYKVDVVVNYLESYIVHASDLIL